MTKEREESACLCQKACGSHAGATFQQLPSLPAALPVIYKSVTDTRIGSRVFKHRLLTSRCSHSLSLMEVEDFQNSLSEFYFHFSFPPPPFAVCISLSLVRDTLNKRGALSLSHSNAPQLHDPRRTINHAVSEHQRSWVSNTG